MTDNVVKLFIDSVGKKYMQVIKLSSRFPFIIGRQSPDLMIKDSTISRKHCQLVVEAGGLFIEDLGSSHGTDVNGSRIKKLRLRIDDQIKLGDTRIKVLQIDLATKKAAKSGGSY